ncbi:molybdopterin-guanine dinucleotide biosynthesis protein B [uncultured Clostridium sp.]|uniref:molybdopterin-guanine dinucleotide biosynthesis protein B n=1 Tax=uncultured Clostridium sp. TaxID=59620 RepID=UPI0025D01D07|nr:molybdopterin-guanine dinucleotide biosynthesis protein B [uncultured Clostridium sp.]
MRNKVKPVVFAVSGVKNSGKTTLIEKIIPKLKEHGLKVATIKHDGHDFEGDVEGTDTYKHKRAGAYGTAIFSKNKFMIIKDQKDTLEEELMLYFKDSDVIILEGFKYSDYPKLEIVRKGNSEYSVCRKETLLAIVSDMDIKVEGVEILDLNDIDKIADFLLKYIGECRI